MAEENEEKLSAVFGPTAACMPVDELALALAAGAGESRRAAQAHLAECAYCRAELELLKQFESCEPRADEQAAVDSIVARLRRDSPHRLQSGGDKHEPIAWWKGIWTPRVLAPVSLAFAALLIAVVLIPRSHSPAGPVAPEANEVMRSHTIKVTSPKGDVAEAPAELSWKAVPGAVNYTVRLMEVDRTALWSESVSQPGATIPAAMRERILPGKTLLWEVTAVDSSGAIIAESGTQRFRLENNARR